MHENRLEDESLPWVQVSIQVSQPAEEGLANLLFELEAGGLISQGDQASGVCLTAYFPSDNHLPSKLQAVAHYLTALAGLGIDPGPTQIQLLPWRESGEAERWKDFFKPLLLGRRLVIKPTWEDYLLDPSEVIIEIDPGRAFGTGRHPSTALCLRFLERWVRGGEGVLDLGTGSGILAIAAAKLGARLVKALEVDAESARIARQNFELNRVEGKGEVCGTSLASLADETFEIVVANLTLEEILPTLSLLGPHLAPRKGILFLSGILRKEMDELRVTWEAAHLAMVELEFQGEWLGVGLKARG